MRNSLRRIGFERTDTRADIGYVAAFFAAYYVLDGLTRRVARLDFDGGDVPVLVIEAATSNPLPVVALVIIFGLAVRHSSSRLLGAWDMLEHGRALRILATPLLLLLTWQGSLYEYNWFLDRAHLADRALVIVLAAASWWRPVFLVPFVLHYRSVIAQFELPFGINIAASIEELLILVILALAAAHLVHVATGRRDSAPVMMVITAGYATHYFIPGRGKLTAGWHFDEELPNLATNGYISGWLGHTDGSWALDLASLYDTFEWPLLLGTLVLEVGVIVFALHHRVMRFVFLPLALFHLVNFANLGYWYANWSILGIALFVLFTRDSLRPWLDRNLTVARAVIMVIAIGPLGATLFHPSGLSWFDAPVSYGQEFIAIAPDGTETPVEVQAFAPMTADILFGGTQFGETRRATGPYGALGSPDRMPRFNALTSVEEVASLELPRTAEDTASLERTERYIEAWIHYANEREAGNRSWAGLFDAIGPVGKYWTSSPGPQYDFDHPVETVEVVRVTGLHIDGEVQLLRQTASIFGG